MVMGDIGGFMSEFHQDQFFSNDKLVKSEGFDHQDQFLNIPYSNPAENSGGSLNESHEVEFHEEESEIFSDIALSYISQMLMDEDDKIVDNFHEDSALRATEQPFYEILGKNYPFSNNFPPSDSNHSSESPESFSPHEGNSSSFSGGAGGGSSSSGSRVVDNSWPYENFQYQLPVEVPSFSSTLEDYWDGLEGVSDLFLESDPAWQFNKGAEEAMKFLPSDDKLFIDLEAVGYSAPLKSKEEGKLVEVKAEKEETGYLHSAVESRGRKNPHDDDLSLEEGRSAKFSARSYEDAVKEEFDAVLLVSSECKFPKAVEDLRQSLQHVVASKSSQNGHAKGSNGGKGRGKKQPKKEVIDLRTLLIHCAQMVAAGDQRGANEMLKQIRQHSSPTGDGSQRLAHYFANGLEARLAGTGSEIYNSYRMKRRSATDILKAYQLYLAACPFKKISYYFANQTILNVSEKAARIHIVDLGISFGFQWPALFQCISTRAGGPPKIRITGIDLPQPGFRPTEKIEETGHRLAEYARTFKVPFEYKAIASKWEDVRVEELDIDKDEVLIVNCLFQSRLLADETVVVDSPRNKVLNTIRNMNPNVFIHGIVNGSFSAPFFVTRFREALYHFSALYDMMETIVPREDEQRFLLEREIFGPEALNVIACEGTERVERPETYKQWQVRNLRAGLVQLPLNEDMMKKARCKVKSYYHKDFIVDEDGRWLLQGWKGRIVYALSTWKPNNAS